MQITTYISKEESNVIKGMAILFMLYFHLFNRVTDGVVDYWVTGQPLTKFLSPAAYPVPFFLLVSGYGLYYSYKKGKLTFISNLKRALRLYIYYWLVMLIFVSIGSIVASWHYPGTLLTFIYNLIGIHCTYNYETWFLLPYIVLSLLSPLIFKGMDRCGVIPSLVVAFVVSYGAQFCISRYLVPGIISGTLVGFALTTGGLLLNFVLGASMMIWGGSTKVESWNGEKWVHRGVCIILLLLLILLRCIVDLPWSSWYTFLFVLVFLNMPRCVWIDGFLMELGKKSMVMWMVHTYFSIYLFHDFIYGFKYPLLIYIVLVVVSYFTSSVLMKLINPLMRIIISNK